MDKADKNVGTGLVGAPACGDVMKLQVRPLGCCTPFFGVGGGWVGSVTNYAQYPSLFTIPHSKALKYSIMFNFSPR